MDSVQPTGVNVVDLPGGGMLVPATVARPGVLEFFDPVLGRKVREYRPTSEVFHPEAIKSLRASCLTVNHPKDGGGYVTPDTWEKHSVGSVGSVDSKPQRVEGYPWLGCKLAVQARRALGPVKERKIVGVSAGFAFRVEDRAGVVPAGEPDAGKPYDRILRKIRYNHVALLTADRNPRAGKGARIRLDEGDTDMKALLDSLKKARDAIKAAKSDADTSFLDQMIAALEAAAAAAGDGAEGEGDAGAADAKTDDTDGETDEEGDFQARVDAVVQLSEEARTIMGKGYLTRGKKPHDIRLDCLQKLGAKLTKTEKDNAEYVAVYYQARVDAHLASPGSKKVKNEDDAREDEADESHAPPPKGVQVQDAGNANGKGKPSMRELANKRAAQRYAKGSSKDSGE